jgi:citrate synthase
MMARGPARGLADVVAACTALSQHADNRLIRPDSEYIGERGQDWVPLGAR